MPTALHHSILGKLNRSVALAVCFTLAATQTAAAQLFSASPPINAQDLTRVPKELPRELTIPETLGRLEEIYEGSGDGLVIYIQDAHANYTAQRSIASIIEHLAAEHGISLVGQEGAEGKIDTTLLRAFPAKEVIKEVLDRRLRCAEIGGPDYVSATSEKKLDFVGVDKQKLYLKNLSEFLAVLDVRDQGVEFIRSVRTAIKNLQDTVYSKPHRELNKLLARHRAEQIDFAAFLTQLKKTAETLGVNTTQYRYFSQVNVMTQVDIPRLFLEIEELTHALKNRLAASPLEHKLIDLEEYLLLFEHGLNLELSRRDVERFESLQKEFSGERIEEFLASALKDHNLSSPRRLFKRRSGAWSGGTVRSARRKRGSCEINFNGSPIKAFGDDSLHGMDEYTARILAFYRTAQDRDGTLTESLKKEMKLKDQKAAVLVAGGFHEEGVTERLRKAKISYVVITPHLEELTSHDEYLKIMERNRFLVNLPERNTLVTPNELVFQRQVFIRDVLFEAIQSASLTRESLLAALESAGLKVDLDIGRAPTKHELLLAGRRALNKLDALIASGKKLSRADRRNVIVSAVKGTTPSMGGILPSPTELRGLTATAKAGFGAQDQITGKESGHRKRFRTAVIGAGIFGVTVAWVLARAGYAVDLYEKNSDIISETSADGIQRIHRGYHYPRSDVTAIGSRDALRSFMVAYGDSVLADTLHYYAIAREGSRTSPEEYKRFLRRLKLPYRLEWPDGLGEENVDLSIRAYERFFDLDAIRQIGWEKLREFKVNVLFREATAAIMDGYDFIVNATYAYTNSLLREWPQRMIDFQFELVEVLVVKLPQLFWGKSILIMDGEFLGIDPIGQTELHTVSDVQHMIHHTNVGKFPEIPPPYENLLHKGILMSPPLTHFERVIEKGRKYFRDFQTAVHVGSIFVIRVVLPHRESDDARPTLIDFLPGTNFINIFSGKIVTTIQTAGKVQALIDERASASTPKENAPAGFGSQASTRQWLSRGAISMPSGFGAVGESENPGRGNVLRTIHGLGRENNLSESYVFGPTSGFGRSNTLFPPRLLKATFLSRRPWDQSSFSLAYINHPSINVMNTAVQAAIRRTISNWRKKLAAKRPANMTLVQHLNLAGLPDSSTALTFAGLRKLGQSINVFATRFLLPGLNRFIALTPVSGLILTAKHIRKMIESQYKFTYYDNFRVVSPAGFGAAENVPRDEGRGGKGESPSFGAAEEDEIVREVERTYDAIASQYRFADVRSLDTVEHRNTFLALVPTDKTLLDARTGAGTDAAWFREQGRDVIGVDVSEGMLNEARARHPSLDLRKMDLRKIELPDGSVGGIWDNAVFHHFPERDARKVIKEYHRVLEPGGNLFIRVKKGVGEHWVQEKDYPVRRFFKFWQKDELVQLVTENGFEIIDSDVVPEGPSETGSPGRNINFIVLFARRLSNSSIHESVGFGTAVVNVPAEKNEVVDEVLEAWDEEALAWLNKLSAKAGSFDVAMVSNIHTVEKLEAIQKAIEEKTINPGIQTAFERQFGNASQVIVSFPFDDEEVLIGRLAKVFPRAAELRQIAFDREGSEFRKLQEGVAIALLGQVTDYILKYWKNLPAGSRRYLQEQHTFITQAIETAFLAARMASIAA